jgi:hypothetical protein
MKSKQTTIKQLVMTAVIAAVMCISLQTGYVAASPVISVEPTYTGVSYGETFTVNITIDPCGDEVMGVQYYLYFNNTLLNATEQTQGTFLSHDGAGTNTFANKVNNTIGVTEYGETRIMVENGVTDPGVLASVTFDAIEPGVCDLTLKDVVMSDTNGAGIPDVTVRTGRVGTDQPSTPFLICGHISHGDGSECNNPVVNVTNLNTSRGWTAVAAEGSNYYQIVLASPGDVIAGDVLRFEVVCGDGSNVTEHTVTQAEVDAGGFGYDIVLDVEALLGDLNSDGMLTTADAAIALRMAVCGGYDRVADVNNDKSVTPLDALMILQAASV